MAVMGRAVAYAVVAGSYDEDLDAVLAVVAWFAFVRFEAVRV